MLVKRLWQRAAEQHAEIGRPSFHLFRWQLIQEGLEEEETEEKKKKKNEENLQSEEFCIFNVAQFADLLEALFAKVSQVSSVLNVKIMHCWKPVVVW